MLFMLLASCWAIVVGGSWKGYCSTLKDFKGEIIKIKEMTEVNMKFAFIGLIL